ncbi:MAG: hypothetical protein M0Z31_14890 [Clostridia bacterium]|nr:hypothetical protein [Clostridia bacterium]
MEYLYSGVVIFSLGLLVSIYLINRKHRVAFEQEKTLRFTEEERLERERIKFERQEKRKLELVQVEKEKTKRKVREELTPILENFIRQNLNSVIYQNIDLVKGILLGRPMTVKELLQHNVNRKFEDGSKYRVGLVKKVGQQELSMSPDTIIGLQFYFEEFMELLAVLKTKGIEMDKSHLHDLLMEEHDKFLSQYKAKTS